MKICNRAKRVLCWIVIVVEVLSEDLENGKLERAPLGTLEKLRYELYTSK
jgi:hypothetical protein